jgi:ABC-type glycerol-3-phosphate transport system substrate-binding protein
MRIRTVCVILAAAAVVWLLSLPGLFSVPADEVFRPATRINLLDDAEAAAAWLSYNRKDAAEERFFPPLQAAAGEGCSLVISIPETGEYHLILGYTSDEASLFENTAVIIVNDLQAVCALPLLWADEPGAAQTDRYGNEMAPNQIMLHEASFSWLEDYTRLSRTPMLFPLAAGENHIRIIPQNQRLDVIAAIAVKPAPEPDYEAYRRLFPDVPPNGALLVIEGEHYRLKSDSYIRGYNASNTGVVPNSPTVKRINAIDDKSFKTVGQKLLYEAEIPSDGWYTLTVKYCQPLKAGGVVYRTVEIDGAAPFCEARDVPFPHTGMGIYRNRTLDQPFFLTAGVHTIALKATAGPLDAAVAELLTIVDEISDTGVTLRRIKGSHTDDTARIDVNRTWDVLMYMPDILVNLADWESRLYAAYGAIRDLSGTEPSFAGDLKLAAQNLARLASEPREIPNRSALLCDDAGSAAQLTANVVQKLTEQPMSIDRFYLHGAGLAPPSPQAGFRAEISTAVRQFLYSFSPVMNVSANIKNTAGALTVWVGKPSQYADVLRTLTAQDFTAHTGIDVVFSIMPDEKKITLANATGSNPDVALSLSYYRPAEFAMRGMAKNLLEYGDFTDWYGAEYNLESLAPMAYGDGVYGASETQEFYVLFYRKDILDALGLDVPDTWDDVRRIMPTLLRNAMNFNHPLANDAGYKPFAATGMFIFQNGGNYYAPDGFTANFNDPATLRGLREMTDLYRTYGLAQHVPNFFNAFRSGAVPIGVSNFATYLQLQVAAPELAGRWDIAPVPGTAGEDGVIRRDYSADETCVMIFANTAREQEAYAFVKWWLSGETQLRYARDLQRMYGPEFVWNTGNHAAFARMAYPSRHRQVILEQWQWQKETLRHPASYILEREVSNAWIDIVVNGARFQPRIDDALLAANREMRRKLTEFGYIDADGNRLKAYNVHLIDDLMALQRGDMAGE